MKNLTVKAILLFFTGLITWSESIAQAIKNSMGGRLNAAVTVAQFIDTESSTPAHFLELYWTVEAQTLAYKAENENQWQGEFKTQITLSTDENKIYEEGFLTKTPSQPSMKEAHFQKIMDMQRIILPKHPAKYLLRLELEDLLQAKATFVYEYEFDLDTSMEKIRFSDIVLVDTQYRAAAPQADHPFYKHHAFRIPNAGNFINEHQKHIHFYTELYDPAGLIDSLQPVIIHRYFSKRNADAALHGIVERDTVVASRFMVYENTILANHLASGNYDLHVRVSNFENRVLATQHRFFQIYNPKPEKPEIKHIFNQSEGDTANQQSQVFINIEKTFVGKYTLEQIRAILKMLLPIASASEKRTILDFGKKADDTYSRYFIYNFWVSRNREQPEAAWKAYVDEVKKVNKLFGNTFIPGYESERGIVQLKYGIPTERITVYNEQGTIPYEVWQYNTVANQSNGMFLFYRPDPIANNFRLLHSTVQGEPNNRGWRNFIYINPEKKELRESRAEQYFFNE